MASFSTDQLILRARDEYGELVDQTIVYPNDGLSVRLIGGERVCYLITGEKASTMQPSWWSLLVGRVRSWWHRLLR